MSNFPDETAVVVRDLAFDATEPTPLEPGKIYGWLSNGQVHKIDLTADQHLAVPRRKRGIVTVRDVASFAQYWDKHRDDHSEVYADFGAATVTAVLDAHRKAGSVPDEETPRWQQHRLVLALQHTVPWLAWTARDGRLMDQPTFAEFVEDRAKDVIAPAPESVTSADLLEVAQSFQAHTSVQFKSGHRVSNGQTQFEYTEQTDATARTSRGVIEIPNDFTLGIRPFDDCEPMAIRARFRYRLIGGVLTLGFRLDDADGVSRDAVKEVTAKLAAECGVTVMHGQPA